MDKCLGIKFDGLSVGEYMAKQEAQLAQQADLIERALEVLRWSAKIYLPKVEGFPHFYKVSDIEMQKEAQVLIPALEAALKPSVNNLHREI